MIDYIYGKLAQKAEDYVVIDTGALGYKVFTPVRISTVLPPLKESIMLYTHFVHKEDAMELYGFLKEIERNIYRQLLSVSGVGPKLAMKIISDLESNEIIQSILTKDHKTLATVNGLGKKTAEKVILELESKFKKLFPFSAVEEEETSTVSGQLAVDALLSLGYRDKEASEAVRSVLAKQKNISTEETIKEALLLLSKL